MATELWSPRFVTECWNVFFPFAMLLQCVEIEFLATVGSKWGCQPFGCPCSQDVTHCQKVSFSRYLPFVKSKSPLPTRSLRSLRAAAHSTSSGLCLHHAHPFVAAAEKHLSHAEKQRVWSRSCGVQDFLQYCDCALSCGMRLLQTNEHLSRLSF